jgi:hypothetical protein
LRPPARSSAARRSHHRVRALPLDLAVGDGELGGSILIVRIEREREKKLELSLWIGFLFALAAFVSYGFFAQFPITRDFPWANLLLFAAGGICLVVGLFVHLAKCRFIAARSSDQFSPRWRY